jgi:hypothetical protein
MGASRVSSGQALQQISVVPGVPIVLVYHLLMTIQHCLFLLTYLAILRRSVLHICR